MSSKYGFGGGIELPVPTQFKPRVQVDEAALRSAVEAGERLGFVAREPASKRKPGPKRTEVQDKVSIPGPKRVIEAFRTYCTDENLTLWQGLELLLEVQKVRKR